MKNKKRYWLRGGLIGGIFGLILLIITYVYYEVYSNFGSFFGINEYILGNISNYYLGNFLYISFNILEWFVIGALIGYTYGKIKNKNQEIK